MVVERNLDKVDYFYTLGELKASETDIAQLGKLLGWNASAHPANIVSHAREQLKKLKELGVVETVGKMEAGDADAVAVGRAWEAWAINALTRALRASRDENERLTARLRQAHEVADRLKTTATTMSMQLQRTLSDLNAELNRG